MTHSKLDETLDHILFTYPMDTKQRRLEAKQALLEAFEQSLNTIVGEDESHIVIDNSVAIDSCDSYKGGDCNCPAGERNQIRHEQRNEAIKVIRGEKS